MNYGTRLTIEDKVSSLFQLDPVLPAEYQDTFRRRTYLEPEKTLMLAVLEDAITCFQKYARARHSKTKHLFREAEEWILEKDSKYFFSFEQICASLGFEPGYVRNGLIKEKEKLTAPTLTPKHRPTGENGKKRSKRGKVRLAA
ncbi:MAG TPA: hypothetical protein VGL70_19850 [Candidatus Binatia bacterium]|jgi:hypothetical protein